jgi:hypothetical protein
LTMGKGPPRKRDLNWGNLNLGGVALDGIGEPWYVSNVSIIFDAPCLFLHHLPIVSLHFVALLCIFRN